MKPLNVEGMGLPPEPSPLAVPSRHAPHISESPYWGPLRATAASSVLWGKGAEASRGSGVGIRGRGTDHGSRSPSKRWQHSFSQRKKPLQARHPPCVLVARPIMRRFFLLSCSSHLGSCRRTVPRRCPCRRSFLPSRSRSRWRRRSTSCHTALRSAPAKQVGPPASA